MIDVVTMFEDSFLAETKCKYFLICTLFQQERNLQIWIHTKLVTYLVML